MFAGRMKLKHFLLVALVVVGVAGAAGLWTLWRAGQWAAEQAEQARLAEQAEQEAAMARRVAAEEQARAAARQRKVETAGEAAPAGADRPWDAVVMGYQGKDLGTDKQKDVTKGKPYKVNLYQDAGEATCNRAKVDLDRDDKWDEKWTFDGAEVTRQVAPADDDAYTLTYRWSAGAWVQQ